MIDFEWLICRQLRNRQGCPFSHRVRSSTTAFLRPGNVRYSSHRTVQVTKLQCCGSWSTCIRIIFDNLDSYPHSNKNPDPHKIKISVLLKKSCHYFYSWLQMVATERVKQGPQRDNYLAWGLFQVPTLISFLKCPREAIKWLSDFSNLLVWNCCTSLLIYSTVIYGICLLPTSSILHSRSFVMTNDLRVVR